ncbi:hypothetical protein, partial [Streptomyces albidoflavus]|uniref:hypothetical protein n=1 Tax=Streptomyces albidoflavus TaxID=1886 RepID=UPI0015C6A88C
VVRLPVHLGAQRPRLTQRQREPLQTTLIAPQRADDTALHARVLDGLLHPVRHHRLRTHLHAHPEPVAQQHPRHRLVPSMTAHQPTRPLRRLP